MSVHTALVCRPHLLTTWTSLLGFKSVLVNVSPGPLQSERFRERARRKLQWFLALEVTCRNFCHILLGTQTHADKIWEGTIQKGKFRETWASLGAVLKLTTINLHRVISLGVQTTAVCYTMLRKGRSLFAMLWDNTEFQQH